MKPDQKKRVQRECWLENEMDHRRRGGRPLTRRARRQRDEEDRMDRELRRR